jgi:hypothetical protein
MYVVPPKPDSRAWKTYLITFSCYGQHLHGDEDGSVDRRHNRPGSPLAPASPGFSQAEKAQMKETPYSLDSGSRAAVLHAIREVCEYRGWGLEACHVRTTHVHAVVASSADPERVMNDFKGYASRALNELGERRTKRWARHGSTRRVSDAGFMKAVQYVLEGQGEPMAVWPQPRDRRPTDEETAC